MLFFVFGVSELYNALPRGLLKADGELSKLRAMEISESFKSPVGFTNRKDSPTALPMPNAPSAYAKAVLAVKVVVIS
jgi:hypothetical protein